MNSKLKSHHLPLLTAGMGAAALVLRSGLYLLGTDEKGLLVPGHPLSILTWVVTAAAIVLTGISVWKLNGSSEYEDNFGSSLPAAAGMFVLAGGIAGSVISEWQTYPVLELLRNAAGLLAAVSLVPAGLNRRQGKRPFFGFHAVVCIYLTLHAVSHYQNWSSRPQMQNYLFPMMASVLLALFAYYQAAFDVSMGKRRPQLITGLLAAFFCIAAVAGWENVLLYLTGSVWTLTNLCSLTPVRRRRRNPITETEREELQ